MSHHDYDHYQGDYPELMTLLGLATRMVSTLYQQPDEFEAAIASQLQGQIPDHRIQAVIDQVRQQKIRIDDLVIATRW